MKKLPILVGTALAIGFGYATAQTHDGYGEKDVYWLRSAGAAHHVPAVAVAHDVRPFYGHGPALHDSYRQPHHRVEHGRRELDRRPRDGSHGSPGH